MRCAPASSEPRDASAPSGRPPRPNCGTNSGDPLRARRGSGRDPRDRSGARGARDARGGRRRRRRGRLRRPHQGVGEPAELADGGPLPLRHPRGHPAAERLASTPTRDGEGVLRATMEPPRFFRLSYLATAWTQRPEDEHRLLAAMLSAFIRVKILPADLMTGSLTALGIPVMLEVAKPPPENRQISEVWTALGGELKASLDLMVTAPMTFEPILVGAPRPRAASVCAPSVSPVRRARRRAAPPAHRLRGGRRRRRYLVRAIGADAPTSPTGPSRPGPVAGQARRHGAAHRQG